MVIKVDTLYMSWKTTSHVHHVHHKMEEMIIYMYEGILVEDGASGINFLLEGLSLAASYPYLTLKCASSSSGHGLAAWILSLSAIHSQKK